MFERNAVVAVYESHIEVEEAIHDLFKSGFDMKKTSIVARDNHNGSEVEGYYNAGNRMRYWGRLGSFWSDIWELLFGWAFYSIPNLGPILVAGPLAGWILAALEDGATLGGVSVLGAALYNIGIPKDSVVSYESAVKAEKFMLIAHGTVEEVAKAMDTIKTTRISGSILHAG
jgi:hypothetical protein